jgi:hypothetical protein
MRKFVEQEATEKTEPVIGKNIRLLCIANSWNVVFLTQLGLKQEQELEFAESAEQGESSHSPRPLRPSVNCFGCGQWPRWVSSVEA